MLFTNSIQIISTTYICDSKTSTVPFGTMSTISPQQPNFTDSILKNLPKNRNVHFFLVKASSVAQGTRQKHQYV